MPLPFLRRMHRISKKYPTDQRDRALRMALQRLPEYASPWAAAQALGPKLGVGPETLRTWVVPGPVSLASLMGPGACHDLVSSVK